MPPSCLASSKALVAIGPSHLSTGIATEGVLRPTTSRALVLRNGRYGTMGTGELVSLRRKLTGKEKLDLLAGTKRLCFAASAIHSTCRGQGPASHIIPLSA